MKRIEVAVGIIVDQGKVLIGQRLVEDAYFRKWEFPGGKLEKLESAEQALIRELNEELGISVHASKEFMVVKHDYPDRQVMLYVRLVTEYSSKVTGNEGQALKWVNLEELSELDFLQGNQAIIDKLQLEIL